LILDILNASSLNLFWFYYVHMHTHTKTQNYMYGIEFLKMYLAFKSAICHWLI